MNYLLLLLNFILVFSISEKELDCEDLLAKYGKTHQHITFLTCTKGTGQVIKEAKYKVAAKYSKTVEKFLVQNYHLGKLKFTCCGWESKNGKNGTIKSKALAQLNPNYILDISMFANAEKTNKNGESYIEKDRTQLDFFVHVKILDI